MLASRTPFVRGRDETLYGRLVGALQERGAQAEALHLPFTCEPDERLIEEMLVARTLRLRNVDRVIALDFPAYLVPHPNKVYWLTSLLCARNGRFDPARARLRGDERGRIQSARMRADDQAFGEAHSIYVGSDAMVRRLQHDYGVGAVVLQAPTSDIEWTSAVERLLT